jgi:predicted RNA-binding protein YlxR (DUF448 family)
MGPTRRCLGCRRSDDKDVLLRVVAVEAKCVVDWEGVLPGRGAYVHPARKCIMNSLRKGVWPEALKRANGLDVTELENWEATASHTEMAERLMDLS